MSDIDYEQERDDEQLSMLSPAIDAFVEGYQQGRPTVILLPGGMGSCLRRATGPFYPPAPPETFDYSTLWIAPALLCDAANLGMHDDIDAGNHVMISDGQVRVLGVGPYDRFITWGARSSYNVFVYGWDWRRPADTAAIFFGETFLPTLRAAVQKQYGLDPLADFTVVAHSFGGLLLKLWLSGGGELVNLVRNAVTVATPFYGYGGQVHRYFAGEALLNDFYSPAELAAVIASLHGPYELMFMPHETWLRDKAAFESDEFPLDHYPSEDSDTGNPADPYHPVGQHGLVRYPTAAWFEQQQLTVASDLLVKKVTFRLPPTIAAKTHNWRCVRTHGRTVLEDTCWKQQWKLIKLGFDPDNDPDPITDHWGQGDDTIPAWSARLASTPAANVYTFRGDLHHMFLMEYNQVLQKLNELIGRAPAELVAIDLDIALGPVEPWIATQEETRRFLTRAKAAGPGGVAPPASGNAGTILSGTDPAQVRSIVRRFMADVFKR